MSLYDLSSRHLPPRHSRKYRHLYTVDDHVKFSEEIDTLTPIAPILMVTSLLVIVFCSLEGIKSQHLTSAILGVLGDNYSSIIKYLR